MVQMVAFQIWNGETRQGPGPGISAIPHGCQYWILTNCCEFSTVATKPSGSWSLWRQFRSAEQNVLQRTSLQYVWLPFVWLLFFKGNVFLLDPLKAFYKLLRKSYLGIQHLKHLQHLLQIHWDGGQLLVTSWNPAVLRKEALKEING